MRVSLLAFALAVLSTAAVGATRFTESAREGVEAFSKSPEAAYPATAIRARGVLKKGAKGDSVSKLRDAMASRGLTAPKVEGADVFDDSLLSDVRAAQEKWGLEPDGMVSDQFLERMALSGQEKGVLLDGYLSVMADIETLMQGEGVSKWLVVNAATYSLKAFRDGVLELESKVIVGRPARKTPRGRMHVTAVKYNPTWSPPPTIMEKDVLPSLDSGSDWIEKHGLVMVDRDGEVVDHRGVTSEEFRSEGYRFFQPAGDENALGVLKFETDSKSNIYLHDTNQRRLFSKASRAQSSGCIRVEKWRDLASWVLEKPVEHVDAAVGKRDTKIERIPARVPVFVIYSRGDVVAGKNVFFPNVYSLAGGDHSSYLAAMRPDEKALAPQKRASQRAGGAKSEKSVERVRKVVETVDGAAKEERLF